MSRTGFCCCGGIGFVPDQWRSELPGGLVDDDEEPADAAVRELAEETGYRAGRVEPTDHVSADGGARVTAEQFAYVGREPKRIGEPTVVNEEVARMEWVPLASVHGFPAFPSTAPAILGPQ